MQHIVRPLVAVKIGLHTVVFRRTAIGFVLHDLMNATEESIAALCVHVRILRVRWNIGDDEYLGEAGLTVEVAAWEQQRIAVQIVEHIAMLERAAKFLKNKHVLSVVGIERMLVVGDTIAVFIAVCIHYAARFTAASPAENVGHVQLAPTVFELRVTIHGADTLHLFKIAISRSDGVDDFLVGRAILYHADNNIGIAALALSFDGHFAALFKGVGEIHALV